MSSKVKASITSINYPTKKTRNVNKNSIYAEMQKINFNYVHKTTSFLQETQFLLTIIKKYTKAVKICKKLNIGRHIFGT